MSKLKITDIDIKNKKILIRCDFNVPLDKQGHVCDATRIEESLPTLRYALDQGASIIIMSHLGRPSGKKEAKYSLTPVLKPLEQMLSQKVKMAPDCIGMHTEQLARELKPHEVLLLENLRFYPAEEKPELDPSFAKQLSCLGQVYVNDAFAADHRRHSSITEIAKYFPTCSVMGLLVDKEVKALSYLSQRAQAPFVAIIGGAKVSTKIGVLQALTKKANTILIGGAMTYTFMAAKGIPIGGSLFDEPSVESARAFLSLCKERSVDLHLPYDLVIKEVGGQKTRTIPMSEGIPAGWEGMDIGPDTLRQWQAIIHNAKTIFWNGPVGVFEIPPFHEGTQRLAELIAEAPHAKTFIGGGDSLAAIATLCTHKKYTHLSTGGGASLEFIELGTLPGIEALTDKKC